MDIILASSIIAAFLAGMVALFAPCCITVLLPAYLASAFREKKNMLKMTLVFFLGVSAILVPIGLGAAGLAKLFSGFHKEMYILGGLLMIVLAYLAILGKGLTLIPMPKRVALKTGATSADQGMLGSRHIKSVFLLGLFSGAATSCCAPVLAGAVTLAVISGVFWKALIVTFAYVFGMTFPLFVTAYLYDRFKIENSRFIKGRFFEMKLPAFTGLVSENKRVFRVHSTNLLAGAIFLVMGIILLFLAFSENAFWAPFYQVTIGKTLNQWSENALSALSVIPDFIWGILIVGLFLFMLYRVKKNARK